MRPLVLVLFAFLLPFSSHAREGGSSVNGSFELDRLTCAQAQDTVTQRGAVLFYYRDARFDRVVRDSRYCPYGSYLRPIAFDLESRGCFVGYTCTSSSIENR